MVELRYSGGPNNKFAVASLGGVMSSEVIPDNSLENLWDDVNRVEVINGRTEHRLFYLYNSDAEDYLKTRFITLVIPADTEIAFALGPSVTDGSTEQLLVTEDSTPSGLTWFDFDDWDDLEIPIGTVDQSAGIPIWMRRKVIIGSDSVRTISLIIDGIANTITSAITQDFGSVENSFDNEQIIPRSSRFLTDVDFVGEALTS